MTDVYVYYFLRSHGPAGEKSLSHRRATLETIKDMGEPVMESQIVVDHTEVDGNGFLMAGLDNESQPEDESWAQIRSLERRAHSRDCEALLLNEGTDGARKYLLSLESRELRGQAKQLRKQRAEALAGELGDRIDAPVFANLGNPITG
ncbi:MAG: hypothetical protein ACYDBZ_05380 [Steroidobacteraceae bacterium]